MNEVIKKDVAKYDLNLTEFSVLELLYHQGKKPKQLLGKKVLIANSITYVVDKLVAKNYIVRKSCPEDRRVTFVELSNDGNRLMDDLFPKHEIVINHVFQEMDPSEIEVLIATAKKVGDQAQAI